MASRITKFVRTTRLRRRLCFGLASVASHGVFVGAVLYVVDQFYPSLNPQLLAVGIAWLALVVIYHLLRRGMSLSQADRALSLQDRLVTWWSVRERSADGMSRWLEDDLTATLAAVPGRRRGQLWRRPLRRLLWLVPLLLLVWWIGPLGRTLFLPSPSGVDQQEDRGPTGAPDVAGGDGGRKEPSEDSGHERSGKDKPPTDQPDRKTLDPPPRDPGSDARREPGDPLARDGVDLPPRPIPELPSQDEFVIPDFIGDDAGKKQIADVAVIEESDRTTAGKVSKHTGDQPPEDRRPEFQAAAEEALRARHVPPKERAFVRRYFEELVRGKR